MTGPASIFEGRFGFFNAYGNIEQSDITKLTEGLGMHWESTRISIKPYPCCHLAHAFIDCANRIKTLGIEPLDICRIVCVIDELGSQMICEPAALKKRPRSAYAAKFSLPFLVASALTIGKARHTMFSETNLRDKKVLDLAARVEYRVAKPGETTYPFFFPGWIVVHLKDGRSFEERLEQNLGSPENPLSQYDLEAKFLDNLAGINMQGRKIISVFNKLENVRIRDFRSLLGTS